MDRLLEAFEREFTVEVERQVAAAFTIAEGRREHSGVSPFTDDEYIVEDRRIRDAAMKRAVRALLAQRFYENDSPPDWAPMLPLSRDQCARLIVGSDIKQRLLGFFARSWRWTSWDLRHPMLLQFGCAVMAGCHSLAARPLQQDFELRSMFPPRPLAGFSGDGVRWVNPYPGG